MGSARPRESNAETSQPEVGNRQARRFHTGVRGPILVVACCSVFGWSAWSFWKSWYPVGASALQLHYGKTSQRIRAARELRESGVKEPGRGAGRSIDEGPSGERQGPGEIPASPRSLG